MAGHWGLKTTPIPWLRVTKGWQRRGTEGRPGNGFRTLIAKSRCSLRVGFLTEPQSYTATASEREIAGEKQAHEVGALIGDKGRGLARVRSATCPQASP